MITYLKIAGVALVAAVLFGSGIYVGSLHGDLKAQKAKTAQEAQGKAIARTDVKTLEQQAAQQAAQAINDNLAEQTHAQDVEKIDTGPIRSDPVVVRCHQAKATGLRAGNMPGGKASASPLGISSTARGALSGGGDGIDRRPEIEALKKRLERIAADERLLIEQWQK